MASHETTREAVRYVRATARMLRRAGHPAASELDPARTTPKQLRDILSRPFRTARNAHDYESAKDLGLHAACLLEGAEFRYAKARAASARGARLSDCILFRSGDPRIGRDKTAYRIQTTKRPDGHDIQVSDGPVPMTTDARTMEAAGAIPVRRSGLVFPIWTKDGGDGP